MRRIIDKATDRGAETISYDQALSAVEKYLIDYRPQVVEEEEGVETVTWTVDEGNNISISSEEESYDIASALITSNSTGRSIIKITATMCSGIVRVKYIKINVTEPNILSSNDYCGCG